MNFPREGKESSLEAAIEEQGLHSAVFALSAPQPAAAARPQV